MSRGGRGRGRGGRQAGPDVGDEDDEPPVTTSTKPEPLFPHVDQTTPKPPTASELASVNEYRRFRDQMRDGPLYTVLEPSSFTDEFGKVNKRAGIDPFQSMPTYTNRYKKPRRTLPDLSGIPYVLEFFPKELWSVLDPKKISPEWQTLPNQKDAKSDADRKRKREAVDDEDEEEDEDEVLTAGRKKRPQKRDDPTKQKGQKKGLEAEDDYGTDKEEAAEDPDAADEPEQDSEFSESDDGAGDDYNAENYFDAGEDDDVDEGGGGDDDYF